MRSARRSRTTRGDAEDARSLCPRSRPRSRPVWSELLRASWGSPNGGGWLLPTGMKAEPGPRPIFASGKCYLIARKISRRTRVVSGEEALKRHLWSQRLRAEPSAVGCASRAAWKPFPALQLTHGCFPFEGQHGSLWPSFMTAPMPLCSHSESWISVSVLWLL